MSSVPPAEIGPYVVEGEVARGSRSVAYVARDTRLGRRVLVKTVPPELAEDERARRRFERQARLLASLNHPNLAKVHGLETVSGRHFLVLELVEGPTLAERLERGRLPLRETLKVGLGIAAGLEAAHGQGVVHRNLQPVNVRLASGGEAKVVDFDTAFSAAGGDPSTRDTLAASTDRSAVVHYTSPEQVRGREVDERTDIWSLGCILYECLTGRRAFAGEPMAALAAIDRQEVSFDALPYKTPEPLRRLLERCLAKDPEKRPRHVRELRARLSQLQEELHESTSPGRITGEITMVTLDAGRPAKTSPWAAALAGLAAGVLLTSAAFRLGGPGSLSGTPSEPLAVDLLLPPQSRAMTSDSPLAALSPDGRHLVFRGRGLEWRSLAAPEPVHLTRGSPVSGVAQPFFSPDGTQVGFAAGSTLWKARPGGDAERIAELGSTIVGATWVDDGTIVASVGYSGGLLQVPADGGEPRTLTTPDRAAGDVSHRWPHALPGGRAVLFSVKDRDLVTFDDAKIGAVDLRSGEVRMVYEGGMSPRYVGAGGRGTGHLLFVRRGVLLAAPFDAEALQVRGPPRQVVDGVAVDSRTGHAYFGFSPAGTFFYLPRTEQLSKLNRIMTVDPAGREAALSENLEPRSYTNPVLSPDGKRFVLTVFAANNSIWIYDKARDVLEMLVFGHGNNWTPVFSRDGRQVAFASDRGGRYAIYSTRVDGSGEAELLYEEDGEDVHPLAWGDGVLAFVRMGSNRVFLLSLDGSREVRPFPERGEEVRGLAFSPDGRVLAFQSASAGVAEVYVTPFPGPLRPVQVSAGGGHVVNWSPDGEELFVGTADGVVSFPVTTNPVLQVGRSRLLVGGRNFSAYDGERFLYVKPDPAPPGRPRLRLFFNAFTMLENKE